MEFLKRIACNKNCGQKALAGTYLCVKHYLGKLSPDPLHQMDAAFRKILAVFSRELGLSPDFSFHTPTALPKNTMSLGSLVRRLFKRL